MGMIRKDGQYWGDREDNLMHILFSAGTCTKSYNNAYRVILPRLKYMAKQIIRKYYYVQEDKIDDLIMDGISHLLVNGRYDANRKTKMYSYVGTVLKHKFHDDLITTFRYKKNPLNAVDTNYDVSDAEWLLDDYATQPQDEFDTTERQEILQRILSHFNALKAKLDAEYHRINNHGTELQKRSEIVERDLEWIRCAEEYFNKYFLTTNVDSIGLADYIRNNSNIPVYMQDNIARRFIGIGSAIEKFDERVSINEARLDDYGLTYMMDDYPPLEYHYSVSKRTTKKSNRKHNYF